LSSDTGTFSPRSLKTRFFTPNRKADDGSKRSPLKVFIKSKIHSRLLTEKFDFQEKTEMLNLNPIFGVLGPTYSSYLHLGAIGRSSPVWFRNNDQ
jgi:hypothetical protein